MSVELCPKCRIFHYIMWDIKTDITRVFCDCGIKTLNGDHVGEFLDLLNAFFEPIKN